MDTNEVVIRDGSGNVLLSVEVKPKTNPIEPPAAETKAPGLPNPRKVFNLLDDEDSANAVSDGRRKVFRLDEPDIPKGFGASIEYLRDAIKRQQSVTNDPTFQSELRRKGFESLIEKQKHRIQRIQFIESTWETYGKALKSELDKLFRMSSAEDSDTPDILLAALTSDLVRLNKRLRRGKDGVSMCFNDVLNEAHGAKDSKQSGLPKK